ncbi:major facilitator superfamily domain-containing protein [Ilyonectria robusta]|uniref:major facilitator superfamily domain-containing protein n=1 Tax=Ilyonectria robusta TaxID=1079257 RepID=UPI001E8CEFFF|nr:major facilitator superfamily domain-containing protein [Ilyonectria robusta]KAH8665501.1 major facilitator superfamily domain-containing protein [Ilyonectria robusta]
MASTDNAEMATSTHDNRTDSEKAAQLESAPGSETERDMEDAREPVSGDKTDDATLQDAGPPDGGTAAWLVVLGAWCCSFCSPGWINSMGTFQEYYQVGPLHNYSSSTIAWIPSLQLFFLFGLGPIVGRIFDIYGPRPLIIGGTILHVFGLMMASLARTYYQFLLSQGADCILRNEALTTIATWFDKKRGAAMGIMATGSSVGGVIFPIMISRMIKRNGYPWALRAAAFLILGLQIIACFTVRQRTKPAPKEFSAKRLAAPFKEFPFAILLLGIFVLTYGMYIPIDYLPSQGYQEAHMSEDMSQYLVAILNAARQFHASLFGRLGAGYGADLIGRWNMFIIACVVSGISNLAAWIPAKTSSITIGYAIMFGFASGAFVSLVGALPLSVSPVPEIGYRMGVVFLVISIPSLTMAPIGGVILQHAANSWLDLKIFAGVMCLAGSAIILGSRLLYTEKRFFKVF